MIRFTVIYLNTKYSLTIITGELAEIGSLRGEMSNERL